MKERKFSEYCAHCRKPLEHAPQILAVEMEVGRCFCSEECIRDYFQPTIELMEEELTKLRSESDKTFQEISNLEHYRLLTLENPDEIWIEQTESGEKYYRLINHFRHHDERISFIVVCLMIHSKPSFIFLNFATQDEDLISAYRRGVNLKTNEKTIEESELKKSTNPTHFLDSELKQMYVQRRNQGDIPYEDFYKFDPFIELTIEDADEIWKYMNPQGHEWYTFIGKHEDDEGTEFYMVVVCQFKELQNSKEFQIVFAFPTIDSFLVQAFRKGINSLNRAFSVGWATSRIA